MRRRLIQFGAVFVVLAVGVLVFNSVRNYSLHKTADRFVNNVLSNKSQQSFDMLSPGTQQRNPLEGTWSNLIQNLSTAFYGQSPVLSSADKFNGDTILGYDIQAGNGDKYKLLVRLSPHLFGWKIVSFVSARA